MKSKTSSQRQSADAWRSGYLHIPAYKAARKGEPLGIDFSEQIVFK